MGSGSLCDLTLPVKPRCPSPIGLQRLPALLQAPTPDTRPGFPSQLRLTAKPNCKVVFSTKACVGPCCSPLLPFLPCHGADLPMPAPSSLSNAAENGHNPM